MGCEVYLSSKMLYIIVCTIAILPSDCDLVENKKDIRCVIYQFPQSY